MINNTNVEWIKKHPYKIFRVSDFLIKNEYEKLSHNFPNFEDINKENFFKFEKNKFAITSGSKEYNEIILNNEILKKFDQMVNSINFKNLFFYKIYSHILLSRNFDLKHIFKLVKIPKFVDKIESNFILKNLSIFSKLRITIQYSYILNKGKIVPHPDAGDKVLTLLLPFPKFTNNNNKLKHKDREIKYGTTFWNSSYLNLKDQHLSDPHDEDKFKKENKILYETSFNQNEIYGFIKNKHSWHSVEPIDVSDDYVRKSININIYY